jgi:hypothetical protein
MPSEHFSEGECFSLFMTGLFAPALIGGGLAAVAVGSGVYPIMAVETPIFAVIMGSAAFGAGCGLLGVLGFYHWHRVVVEGQRDHDKMPIDAFEED